MKVTIYEQSAKMPVLPRSNFFHSRELMELCERTSRHKPYMAVVTDDGGAVIANLLAIARVQRTWLPPFFITHVRIFGENNCPANHFGIVLRALTDRLQNRTLYIEVSNLSEKMYGYRDLRSAGFFPVRWMNIHNSLHSRTPEERIFPRQLRRIENAQRRGAKAKFVETTGEFKAFSRLLHHHNRFKFQRYIPDDSFFRQMIEGGHCQVFITKYRRKVIGCAVCVYSDNDAYLWYSAARRKSYAPLHPNAVTLWAAIQYAHSIGMQHIRFMDVGLPFRRNLWRDFLLRFGGKEVSGYRWFRISIRWINSLASWFWRE
jgi:hypothetical protein